MSSRRLGLLALLAGTASCVGLPEPRDPWSLEDQPAATPVFSFAWKRVLNDRGDTYLPQEFAAPVLAPPMRGQGEVVFAASQAGQLLALRAADGAAIWRRDTGAIVAAPALDPMGRLFVGTADGALLSISMRDGAVDWRHQARGAVLSSPLVLGDVVLYSTSDDRVFAVDKASGKARWSYSRETPDEFTLRGAPGVVSDGKRAYTGFADGRVVALTVAGGEVAWVRSLAGEETRFVDIDTTPVLSGHMLLVSSAATGVYALDPEDGTELWRVDVPGAATIAVDGARIYLASDEGGLYAVDRDGRLLWRQGMSGSGDPGAIVAARGTLFVSTSEDGVFAVDADSGVLLQRFDPGAGVAAPVAVNPERAFVLANAGTLYALDLVR